MIPVKINGKVYYAKTIQEAVNLILHHEEDNVEFLRSHGEGD